MSDKPEPLSAILALEADNERLADGLVRYRSALNRIRDTIELQGEFDKAGGFHLDNVPACIVAKALLGLEERGDPAPRPDSLATLYAGAGETPKGKGVGV